MMLAHGAQLSTVLRLVGRLRAPTARRVQESLLLASLLACPLAAVMCAARCCMPPPPSLSFTCLPCFPTGRSPAAASVPLCAAAVAAAFPVLACMSPLLCPTLCTL